MAEDEFHLKAFFDKSFLPLRDIYNPPPTRTAARFHPLSPLHLYRLNSLQYRALGIRAGIPPDELKKFSVASAAVSANNDNHNGNVLNYIKTQQQEQETGDSRLDTLAHLADQFELKRWLGLTLDLETKPDNSLFAAEFKGGLTRDVRIKHPRLSPTWFDTSRTTQMSFYQLAAGGKVKRIVYVPDYLQTGSDSKPIPFSDKGILELCYGKTAGTKNPQFHSLTYHIEVLGDMLGNREKMATLLQAQGAHDRATDLEAYKQWSDREVANTNTGFTKGLFLYLNRLNEYIHKGLDATTGSLQDKHLSIGFRVGVMTDDRQDIWSLVRMYREYHIKNHPLFLELSRTIRERCLHGVIRADTGTGTAANTVTIDEKLTFWGGEDLCLPGIWNALENGTAPNTNCVNTDEAAIAQLDAVLGKLEKQVAMPRLRFGQTWQFVVLTTLLNGHSIEFSDKAPTKDGRILDQDLADRLAMNRDQLTAKDLIHSMGEASPFPSQRLCFVRSEAVSPPVFVENEALTEKKGNTRRAAPGKEGEALVHLVTRTKNNKIDPDSSTVRFIVPHSVSFETARFHGVMDNLTGQHVRQWLQPGANGRVEAQLDPPYDDNFLVPYLPDPAAIHFCISFFLDPPNDRTDQTEAGDFLDLRNLSWWMPSTILIKDAFRKADWPDVQSWKLELIPIESARGKLGLVELDADDSAIRVYLQPGAELYCKINFLDDPQFHPMLLGSTYTTDGSPIHSDRIENLLSEARKVVKGQSEQARDYFTRAKALKRYLEDAHYPAQDFVLSHASQYPLMAPSFTSLANQNIAGRFLIAIRQKTFVLDGRRQPTQWSLPFAGDNVFLDTLYQNKLLPETQIKIVDFVRFEHLNTESADIFFDTVGKSGGLDIRAKWREYLDAKGTQYDADGYPVHVQNQDALPEYSYEMGLARQQPDNGTGDGAMHSDDLQLLAGATPGSTLADFFRQTNANANMFTGYASKLQATIDQKDTKFRKKQLFLTSHSKFPSAFPTWMRPREMQTTGASTTIFIPANAKPATPEAYAFLPLVVREEEEPVNNQPVVTKRGNQFRIYFDVNWWQSGAEERVAILCADPGIKAEDFLHRHVAVPDPADPENKPPIFKDLILLDDYEAYFSKTGRDVTSAGPDINKPTLGLLSTADFVQLFDMPCVKTLSDVTSNLADPDHDNFKEPFLVDLSNIHPKLRCWVVIPRYSSFKQRWYVDVMLKEEIANASHTAFVELRLMRFQPFGLDYNQPNPSAYVDYLFGRAPYPAPVAGFDRRKDFRFSEIVNSDIFYLHPTRKLSVTLGGAPGIKNLVVEAAAQTIKSANGRIMTEFWVCSEAQVANDVFETDNRTWRKLVPKGFGTGDTVRFELSATNFSRRMVIKEFELFENSPDKTDPLSIMDDPTRKQVYSQLLILYV